MMIFSSDDSLSLLVNNKIKYFLDGIEKKFQDVYCFIFCKWFEDVQESF